MGNGVGHEFSLCFSIAIVLLNIHRRELTFHTAVTLEYKALCTCFQVESLVPAIPQSGITVYQVLLQNQGTNVTERSHLCYVIKEKDHL